MRRPVCAGRLRPNLDGPGAAFVSRGPQIRVGIEKVKDCLGIAELEIHTSAEHVYHGEGTLQLGSGEGGEVPVDRIRVAFGTCQVDAGLFEVDRGELQRSAKKGRQARTAPQGGHISRRFGPNGGIFADDQILDGETGDRE